jgi:hypothetical protein
MNSFLFLDKRWVGQEETRISEACVTSIEERTDDKGYKYLRVNYKGSDGDASYYDARRVFKYVSVPNIVGHRLVTVRVMSNEAGEPEFDVYETTPAVLIVEETIADVSLGASYLTLVEPPVMGHSDWGVDSGAHVKSFYFDPTTETCFSQIWDVTKDKAELINDLKESLTTDFLRQRTDAAIKAAVKPFKPAKRSRRTKADA